MEYIVIEVFRPKKGELKLYATHEILSQDGSGVFFKVPDSCAEGQVYKHIFLPWHRIERIMYPGEPTSTRPFNSA